MMTSDDIFITRYSSHWHTDLPKYQQRPAGSLLSTSKSWSKHAVAVTRTFMEDICRWAIDGTRFAAVARQLGVHAGTTFVTRVCTTTHAGLRATGDASRSSRIAGRITGAPVTPLADTRSKVTRALFNARFLCASHTPGCVALPLSLRDAVATGRRTS